MAGRGLLPPPGMQATLPKGLTPTERIALWADLVDATEELVKAGLRLKLRPGESLERAFADWCERQHEEHLQMLLQMRKGILEMEKNHARRKAT